jgi:hypothetical protein
LRWTYNDLEGTLTSNASVSQPERINYFDGDSGLQGRLQVISYDGSNKWNVREILPFKKTLSSSAVSLIAISNYETLYNQERGYPSTCLFYQNRLWFNGPQEKANILIGSKIDQYNDFGLGFNNNTDGIMLTLASNDYEPIISLCGNNGIQVFTKTTEYIIPDDCITPNLVYLKKMSSIGISTNIPPFIVNNDTFFIDKDNKNIVRFGYYQGLTPEILNVSLYNNYMLKDIIRATCNYNNVDGEGNFIYILKSDGEIIICNLMQNSISYSRFIFENCIVKDIFSIYDVIYLSILRDGKMYIEKMDKSALFDNTKFAPVEILDDTIKIKELEEYIGNNININYQGVFFEAYCSEQEIEISKDEIEVETYVDDFCEVGFTINSVVTTNDAAIEGITIGMKKRVAKVEILFNGNDLIHNTNILYKEKHIDKYKSTLISPTGWTENGEVTIENRNGQVEIYSIQKTINIGSLK